MEAAIELAADLKARGEYDWFRGQVQCWPPASTLERRLREGSITQDSYIADLGAFIDWAATVPELAYVTQVGGEDAACAILQHHGTPTQYIDFTTEPSIAGFFSADALDAPQPGTESVIYCLQTQDLLRFYEDWKEIQPELQLEAVSIDVSNLWRLQAQHGCFIYANHPWYTIYDLDRIVFPWTGYPAYPQRDQIYPAHKSPLERRLDEYLSVRRRREGLMHARELLRDSPVAWITVTEEAEDTTPVAGQQPAKWPQELLARWTQHAIERFDTTVGPQISLHLRAGPNTPTVGKQVSVAIASMLRKESGLRGRAIDWRFSGSPHAALMATLSEASRTLWNGLRCLPVSDEDLAYALGTLAELYYAKVDGAARWDEQAAGLVFKAPLYVEFANGASVVSRGYCDSVAMREAVSSHWEQALAQGSDAGDVTMTRLLLLNNKPNQVFEFEAFARVFARQIVPSQVALGRDPVLFNPAELSVFGLP